MMVLDEVIGHRTDRTEIGEKDVYYILKGCKRRRKKTTKSHHMLQMERWK